MRRERECQTNDHTRGSGSTGSSTISANLSRSASVKFCTKPQQPSDTATSSHTLSPPSSISPLVYLTVNESSKPNAGAAVPV